MRKIVVFLLAFMMSVVLVACGEKESKPSETTDTYEEEKLFTTISAKDCFYSAGFVELIDGAKEPAEYTFTSENSDAVEWCIYIMDEAFDDGFRYIRQVAEPVLIGNGTVSVGEGHFVYVYCSANEFTTGTSDENAKLNITIK
ncbi:MAG: hypothetical protein IKU54_03515 [Oscillospiraceae bacterium]|nr:hypothetical protein [Oscillospiraceae bacterium]